MIWRVLNLAAAIVLYAIAVSNTAYELTTPISDPHHTLLRKIYALGAFTLLGILLEKGRWPRISGPAAGALVIGCYSWAIELGQTFIDHVSETFVQHGFDVASGVAGGALGTVLVRAVVRRRVERSEVAVVTLLLAVLVATFPVTYGALAR